MIADIISLIEFLRKNWDRCQVINALFDWEGKRIEGSSKIVVDRIEVEGREEQWFYKIKELKDYVFIFMPVIPTYIDYGTKRGDKNPDARFFRFVGNSFSSVISGGNPNVKVSFIVIGYKPKNLLTIKKNY